MVELLDEHLDRLKAHREYLLTRGISPDLRKRLAALDAELSRVGSERAKWQRSER